MGFTAPSVGGQARAVATALAMAEVDARSIGYVEAHGTGTPLGDAIEVEAISRAFATDERAFCRLGSVKANVGHLSEASGMASLIAAVLALERDLRPGQCNLETPNPAIDFGSSPFVVEREARPFDVTGPRRACVNSYAVGGANAHVVLEQAPAGQALGRRPDAGPWAFLLSAATGTALQSASRRLADWCLAHPDADLGDVAFTLATGRRTLDLRRAIVASDRDALMLALAESAAPGLSVASGGAEAPAAVAEAARHWLETGRVGEGALRGRRVRLPVYPFEQSRYWLEPGTASGVHGLAWWLDQIPPRDRR
jgi:acyl transferase domain-containing protein